MATAAAVNSSDASRNSPPPSVRQPSRPVEVKRDSENGHADSVPRQLPSSAGAHSPRPPPDPSPLPSDSEKPTDSASTSASKPPRKPRQKKKSSMWVRFLRSLIPCIGPSSSHPVDIEDNSPLRDKRPQSVDVEKKILAQEASSSTGHTAADPSTTTTLPPPLTIPPQPQSVASPPATGEHTVIVPPSPNKHRLPREETEGVTSGAVQPPGSTGAEEHEPEDRETDRSDSSSFTDEDERGVMSSGAGTGLQEEDLEDEEDRLILNGGAGIPIGPDGVPRPLLPPVAASHTGRKCLVLDLDETLVHSSFKLIPQADYVVPVEIEWQWHNVYVIKRPGVDNFLKQMGELYEIVVFTASLSKYADPVLDKLDMHKVVSHRLFRESCYNHKGNYVKDLSQLGRPISDTIILDNSPASYIFHPNNAVPVSSWFNDPHDTELTDLVPFLADLCTVDDVRGILDGGL